MNNTVNKADSGIVCHNSTSTGTLLREVISGMLCAAFAYECGGPHRVYYRSSSVEFPSIETWFL